MVDRNPASKWDEDTVIYGLTMYDMNRTIRKLPEKQNNAATIEVSNDVIQSLLSDDLKCGVCLGKLENTLATSCLHRFCSDCLQRSLRMELGAKMHHECPSCRAKLASRRSSKPDGKFDMLVQIFSGEKRRLDDIDGDSEENGRNAGSSEARSSPRRFGTSSVSPRAQDVEETVDLKKYRDMHTKNVGKFRELRAQKLLTAAKGQSSSGRKAATSSNTYAEQNNKKIGNANKSADAGAAAGKVWLKLYPVPEWSPDTALRGVKHDATALKTADGAYQLSHPYLRVPPHKSVLSLKAYILHKFQFAPEQVAVEILGQFKNKLTVLDEALTVFDMTTKHWDVRSELVLYFKFAPVIGKGGGNGSSGGRYGRA